MEQFGDDYKIRGPVQPATAAAFCHPLQLLVRTAAGFSSSAQMIQPGTVTLDYRDVSDLQLT
jgi:hypothetical protein